MVVLVELPDGPVLHVVQHVGDTHDPPFELLHQCLVGVDGSAGELKRELEGSWYPLVIVYAVCILLYRRARWERAVDLGDFHV